MEKRVAVIGAGASGLVAARELLREGHSVVIFEQARRIGGTWVYDPPPQESHSRSSNVARNHSCHSSIYQSLRTNLPREVMGFLDYPFVPRRSSRDARRFPGHEEVLDYLESFTVEFGLHGYVRFNSKVKYVGLVESNWIVKSSSSAGKEEKESEEVFDAVVVCNGHYFQPRVAQIPGIEKWPGKQYHSHTYRTPDLFKDQVVAVIGNGPSGQDLCSDIAADCKKVHWCAKLWNSPVESLQQGKIQRHLMISKADKDGRLHFMDGTSAVVDAILHCTGYLYDFSFLDTKNYVKVEDNRVGPLFKHVFPPALAPSLSFIGLPWKTIPFPLSELQAKWISAVLKGRASLPPKGEMANDVVGFYRTLEAQRVPNRHTHRLDLEMFDYAEWLAKQCGGTCHGFEPWRKELFLSTRDNRKLNSDSYRDEWSDNDLHEKVVGVLATSFFMREQ
ncbi:hypothetical protein SELMODRAFT_413958 [Selaginella moellendorffii]|uniref:Flavin-containing monooxygenase n=1 Tax=Selaginella moellendorffii TaxID=88036 RepID=D8RR63_SELML|nr:flavin-containing monooxygenase FMO GS-OX-like 4 [Selaginella moellendorffii]EFJ25343.1 hypothetical protein SELMODRAFT_413958 [Selaginella moellendorffii]|eukprot:XP_002973683.1 flavin-containing monooxygenase FMO GS-OX-like 4 [Selaginella moellendorffii]